MPTSRNDNSREFGSPLVVDESLADTGESADVLNCEWRTGLSKSGQGFANSAFAFDATTEAVFDRLNRAATLVLHGHDLPHSR